MAELARTAQYGATEAGYGFMQVPGCPKATTAGQGTQYGDTLYYDRATDNWKKCTATAKKPFGFNGINKVISQTLNVLTNTTTYTRGTLDADTTLSVVIRGRITKFAEASIPPGEYVMPSATADHEHTHVQAWDGVAADAIIGRYVINLTNHHDADVAPRTTQANDEIKIDIGSDITLDVS